MLKFADLSMSQKKMVVAYVEHNPSLKKSAQITLKEVNSIAAELASKRDSGGAKVGYPNWLFGPNKVDRGVYAFPVPTAAELSQYTKDAATKPVKAAKVAKTPKVKAVKATAKVAKKTSKVASAPVADKNRLQDVIGQSETFDQDYEDFNAILRENGIEVE
jgi:hypothetical protein